MRYHHFTQVYQKSWSYGIRFLRYDVWQMYLLFFILGYTCPFYLPNSPKNENVKKMKKTPGDVIILHKSTKNHDRMLYCPWDMARDICNCHFSFWAIFCPFNPPAPFPPPHLTPKKIKILKNWNFTHVYQKLWLDDVRFLRYGVRRTDGRTDRKSY